MKRGPYVVSARYDWAFFLAPPLVALALGIGLWAARGSTLVGGLVAPVEVAGEETTWAAFFVGALIHAHLVAVLFRSHGNPRVLSRFPVRFLVVPALVWTAIVVSPWLAVLSTVIATFWDVWHSGAQTFGFARIYDRNAGFPVSTGRRLDFWMNQLLYAGPILAGATLMDHLVVLEDFETFDDAFSTFLILVPADVARHRAWLTWTVLSVGVGFVAYYVAFYVRLFRRGVRTSWLKVWLLASTGLCSILTWGLNTWGEAFFIMNFFHAVQYLALVWAMEHEQIAARIRWRGWRAGKVSTLAIFLGSVAAYGVFVELLDPDWVWLWALTMTVSLMHFWYDAFIWSVRRSEV